MKLLIKKFVVLFALSLIMLLFVDCSSFNKADYKCENCNVLFILVDTLRADHLSSYGYYRNTSPNIDSFAEDAILFENVRSQASCTHPSVPSILTSKYSHNFLKVNRSKIIPDHIKSVAEILKEKNYRTFAVSANPIVRKTPFAKYKFAGFDKGFDIFDEGCLGRKAPCLNEKFFDFIENSSQPFFTYLHYMDPHSLYSSPIKKFSKTYDGENEFIAKGNHKPIKEKLYQKGSYKYTKMDIDYLMDLYDDEIAYFDSQFKVLIDKLSQENLTNNTIVVISSDHGEEFLEHGDIAHCHNLFDDTNKVPLIIKIPGIVKRGKRKSWVQNIDIVPTLLDYLGFDIKNYGFDGKNLRPVIASDKSINDYVFSLQDTLRSTNNDQHKLIYDIGSKEFSLFDLITDKNEKENLYNFEEKISEALKKKLFKWLYVTEGKNVSSQQNVDDSKKILKKLKEIGYL